MHLPLRSFATLALAVGVATCSDAPTAQRRQTVAGPARFALNPVFSTSAAAVFAQRATFAEVSFDHVRVVLTRPPNEVVLDTTIVFNPASPPRTLELTVEVKSTGEIFDGTMQYTNNGTVVYSGTVKVQSYPPDQPMPPAKELVLAYVGPGATATRLVVAPKIVPLIAPAGATFTATAFDASNGIVANVPISWQSSDLTVATISATGALASTGKRGAVTVTATTPTGLTDNASVTVTLPPATITLVSGGGQTGKVGSPLAQPAIVQVSASDGVGVAGVAVNFAAPSGGSVGSASTTTDASGRASSALTLGSALGPQSFAATAAGFSVSIGATATTGDPAAIAIVSGSGQQDTVRKALKEPFVVRVTDRFGNAVSGVGVTWARTAGTGALAGTSSVTGADGVTSMGYTLGATVGAETVTATANGVATPVTFSATALSAGPAAIAAVSGSGQAARIGQALAAPFVVKVTDADGTGIGGVPVSWTATNGTLAPSTTTDGQGLSSNTMTAGAVVGAASATATVGGGASAKSTSFTATVQAGIVAKLVFRVAPPNGVPGQSLAPAIQVELQDAAGNQTSAANAVTLALGANPGEATLSGTLTRTSVAGIATFDDIRVSSTGTGYTLVASSAGVPSITSAAFNITGTAPPVVFARLAFRAAPPNGAPGQSLSPAIQVELQDAEGNPTTATNAVTLALGSNQAGAVLSGTLTRAAVAGVATFDDVRLDRAGTAFTLIASSGEVPNVTSSAFDIIAPPTAPAGTWTGAVSSDWFVAGNWGGGVIPTASTNVTIPTGTPNAPVLTANAAAANVTVASGVTLSLGAFTLSAGGNVDAGTTITGTGSVSLGGTGTSVRGTISNVVVTGTGIVVSSTATIPGTLVVGTGASLTVRASATLATATVTVNGGTLGVATGGTFTAASLTVIGANGRFSQTGGTATVNGSATFNGGNTTGLITGGTLTVGGNFSQGNTSTALSFVASGTHRTILNGSAAQAVSFLSAGPSHFQDVSIAGAGAVTLSGTSMVASGQLISPSGPSTIQGGGGSITAAGLDVDGLTIDNAMLASTAGTITRFDNVTFQNYAATATPLTISHPGASTGFTFNNTQFLVTPTSGRYLSVTDTSPTDGQSLVITLLNSTPADGSAQTATSGGALVNWQVAGGNIAWTNPSGGSWSNAANWSLGRVPSTGDAVVIALAGTYTVTLDTTFTATSIALGAASGAQTLALASRTLTMNGVFTVNANGIFAPSSSVVAGSGSVDNQGTISLFSSAINTGFLNRGLLLANASSSLGGSVTTTGSSVIRLEGNGSTGFSGLTVANGFTNTGLIDLTSAGSSYQSTLTVTAGTLTNAPGGTIRSSVGTSGGRVLAVQLDNQGTVAVLQPLTINRSTTAHVNSGTIDATAADLTLTMNAGSSFTNTGTVTIGAGRTWTVTGGALNQSAGAISGSGTLSLSGATATFTTSFTTATTLLALNASTVNGSGTITNAAGRTLTMFSSTIAAPLVNQGTIVANAGNAITGALTTVAGSIIRTQPDGSTGFSTLTVANGFTNLGAIELTSAGSAYASTFAVTSGSLANGPGGTLVSAVGTGGPRTLAAQLDNQGTVTVSQPLTISRASSAHANSGTIDASAADVTLTQSGGGASFTNTGTITIGAGRTWLITNGTLNQSSGTIGGSGTLNLISVTANLTTNFTNATTALILSSTTVNGPGTITNAPGRTLTMQSSTIGATSALINQGTLVANASNGIAGPLTTVAGSILRLQPDGTTGFSNFTVANSFTNLGAIELTSVVASYSSTFVVTNGTLTNAPTGTISSLVGTGGPRTMAAALNNQGQFTVSQPLTINSSSSVHNNSGTIDASAADLTITQSGTAPSFTNAGTITIGVGRTLAVTNGAFNQSAGAISGAGTLSMTSVAASFTTSFTNANTALTLNSTTVNGPGTITNAVGKTLTLNNSTFGPSATLVNEGTVVSNGSSAVNGTFTSVAGSTVRMQPDGTTGFTNLTFANGFTNNGTIELTSIVSSYSAQMTVTAGALTNASGATIVSLPGTGGARTLAARLVNQGLVTVSQPLTINSAGAAHVNNGTIDVSAGNLTVTQSGTSPSFTNAGTLTAAVGWTIQINGGAFTQQGGATLNGGGTFVQTGGTATFNSGFTLGALALTSVTASFSSSLATSAVAMSFNSATINVTGSLTNTSGQTLSVLNTTIGTTTGLANEGTFVTNGTSVINGPFSNAAGAVLRMLPDGTTGVSHLTVNTAFTNNGAIELTSTVSTYSSQLTVPNGTLTNAAGGTITSAVGTGGSRTLTVELNNQGTLTVLQPLTISRSSAVHTNSGTINVSAADLTLTQGGTTPSFTNAAGGTITVGGLRTWTINGGTFTQQAGATLTGGGAFAMTGGAATFNTAFALASMTLTSVAPANFATSLSSATLSMNFSSATVNVTGSLTNATGQTLSLLNTAITTTTGLINQGTLVANGTTTINGALTNPSGGILRAQPNGSTGFANLVVANGFTNNGAIELTSTVSTFTSQLSVTNGTLVNAAGGTIASVAGTGGARTLAAELNNLGLVTINQPLTMNRASSAHSNAGTINVAGGDLTLNQGGTTPSFTNTNTGTVTIGAGRTWTVTGGTLTHQAGGTLTGGALAMSSGSATLNTGFTLSALTLTSVATTFQGNLSTAGMALTLANCPSVNGTGTITNAAGETMTILGSPITTASGFSNLGTLTTNGATTINGAFTTATGSTLIVQPNGSTGTATLTIPSGFTNNGAIELTSTVSTFPSQLSVGTATLDNAAGATITSFVGTGGTRTITAGMLNNVGTITVASGGTGRLSVAGSFTNSGVINLKIGGTGAGTTYDQLAISGAASFGVFAPIGTLNATLVNGFTPAAAAPFDVITYGTGSGSIANYNLPTASWTHTSFAGPAPPGLIRLTAP